ncbi:MAG: hypothetical protein ACRDWG_16495 [Actinomycetes bacterium]
MRTGSPEYDIEPDGLDLDAMFRRLSYRVTVGAAGLGPAAAIRSAHRRRVARAGVGAVLAAAGVVAAVAVGANLLARNSAGSPAGPAAPAPTATQPSTLQTTEPGPPGSKPIPSHLLLTPDDIPFSTQAAQPNALVPALADTRAEECGVRAEPPITGGENAVVLGVGGKRGEIEQYVRDVGDLINAEGWTYGVRSAMDWCFEVAGAEIPGYRLTIRPLGTLSAIGYTATVRVALTTAPDTPPRIHLYAVGRAGTLVTAIRYDVTGTDPDPLVAGFKALVTTGMERLAGAG